MTFQAGGRSAAVAAAGGLAKRDLIDVHRRNIGNQVVRSVLQLIDRIEKRFRERGNFALGGIDDVNVDNGRAILTSRL